MKIYEIKDFLKKLSTQEKDKIIIELYKSNSFVKDYLKSKVNPKNNLELHEKTKKIIKNEFYPDKGDPKLRYSIMKKAFDDFKKISNNIDMIIGILLSHVEYGVEFTNDYGDIDEKFY